MELVRAGEREPHVTGELLHGQSSSLCKGFMPRLGMSYLCEWGRLVRKNVCSPDRVMSSVLEEPLALDMVKLQKRSGT